MNVINKTPLTAAEVKEYIKDKEEKKVLMECLNTFSKISKADVSKITEEIKALNSPRIKEEHIIKLIDFKPEDTEDVHKIFVDTGLTDEEANAILSIVKKY